MSRRDFPALTGLRFFLALWVILHHLTGPGQKLEATALTVAARPFHPDSRRIPGGHHVLRAERVRAHAQLRCHAGTSAIRCAMPWGGRRACIPSTC